MRKLVPLLFIMLLTAGCPAIPALFSPTASGTQQQQQLQTNTLVQLNGQNYRIVKTNVTGTSRGFSLLGFITVVSPNYIKAVQHLYNEAGITEGRALAIANIAQQDTSPYFILFSLPKITLRADVIEFTGPPLTAPSQPPGAPPLH